MRASLLGCAVLVLASCHAGRPQEQPSDAGATPPRPRVDILTSIPTPGFVRLNDTTGTPEAQHLEYGTLFSVDSVHNWYRTTLGRLGWQVQSDQTAPTEVTMYATKDSGAVWLRVWHDSLITRFSLIGSTTSGPAERPRAPAGAAPPSRP